jgi:hypothetical protein
MHTMRFTFILSFSVLLSGCGGHRSSPVAQISQTSSGHFEVRLNSVEWVAGGPCNFPQWPHREFGTCWIYTDSTNGVVAPDRVSLAYGSSDGFRASQEGPLHGSVQFRDGQMIVDLQYPYFTDGVHLDHYEKFRLNGTYKIQTQ